MMYPELRYRHRYMDWVLLEGEFRAVMEMKYPGLYTFAPLVN